MNILVISAKVALVLILTEYYHVKFYHVKFTKLKHSPAIMHNRHSIVIHTIAICPCLDIKIILHS